MEYLADPVEAEGLLGDAKSGLAEARERVEDLEEVLRLSESLKACLFDLELLDLSPQTEEED